MPTPSKASTKKKAGAKGRTKAVGAKKPALGQAGAVAVPAVKKPPEAAAIKRKEKKMSKRWRAAAEPLPSPVVVMTAEKAAQEAEALAFAIEAARLVRDDKCEDVTLLDVRAISQVSDFIIVASGTSDRQMHSVLRHVEELGRDRGMRSQRSSADDRSTWLLLDFVDLVVHLFEPNTRAHYDLEMLWGDAPRVEWERADQMPRDRAGLNA